MKKYTLKELKNLWLEYKLPVFAYEANADINEDLLSDLRGGLAVPMISPEKFIPIRNFSTEMSFIEYIEYVEAIEFRQQLKKLKE